MISPDKNLWYCLGACSEGGDVIQWVMKRQGVSFRHAVELLKDGDAALSVPASPVKRNTTAKHSTPLAANPDDQKQLAIVINYYHHDILKQSPEALDYLEIRGLAHPELIDTFKLGYANRTLGYRLPEKNRKAGAEVRGQLQQIGILRKSGHEHFSGSLVIPVISPEGIDCFRVLFPKGMDANEYAQQVTLATKSLGVVLRSAEWMGKGKAPELNTGCASDEIIDTETGAILPKPIIGDPNDPGG